MLLEGRDRLAGELLGRSRVDLSAHQCRDVGELESGAQGEILPAQGVGLVEGALEDDLGRFPLDAGLVESTAHAPL